uniref:Immediate early response 2 n=1 Tax=Ascaris lumbricoides TaxID=6252 RepID=A0A0M3IM06_ASCLU
MNNTSSDVDEIIENEVCNRLIRLSCAKMVNSKHERGGAKLHRNLLILHLLRRARNEQKRSAPSSPDDLDSHSELCSMSADITESTQSDVSGGAKDVDVDQFGKEAGQLLDLSCSSRADITAGNDPIELHVRDDDEVDYSTLSLEPLLLPFGTDAVEAEELSDMSKSSPTVVPELSPDLCGHLPLIASEQLQPHSLAETASVVRFDADVNEQPPMCFVTSEDEHDPSSSSGSDDDDEADGHQLAPQRRRKRKTSSPRVQPPCTAKKCCVEERHLTGLISVFNSGLSVVADQFMSRSQPNPLLQQTPDQLVPSIMRIACNPLIC